LSLHKKISKQHVIEPVSVFFEDGLARRDLTDANSPMEGLGRFNIEVYLIALLGVDVRNFTPPIIMTVRFLVDAMLPFLILITGSYLTRRGDPMKLAQFYVRLKTPVGATPEDEARAIAESRSNPARSDHTKLFPNTDWEFTKWDRTDTLGFLACCASVGVVLLFLKAVLLIGA